MTRFDPAHLVVLDEFGISLAMARLYARAPRGQRAVGAVPANGGPNVTLLFGLRPGGPVAPFLLPEAIDEPAMVTYVKEVLGPELGPDDVVLLDNVAPHRVAAVRRTIRACGARVRYLPPYSPDFSPIEACGSKVKTRLRAVAARTFDDMREDTLTRSAPGSILMVERAEQPFEHLLRGVESTLTQRNEGSLDLTCYIATR